MTSPHLITEEDKVERGRERGGEKEEGESKRRRKKRKETMAMLRKGLDENE